MFTVTNKLNNETHPDVTAGLYSDSGHSTRIGYWYSSAATAQSNLTGFNPFRDYFLGYDSANAQPVAWSWTSQSTVYVKILGAGSMGSQNAASLWSSTPSGLCTTLGSSATLPSSLPTGDKFFAVTINTSPTASLYLWAHANGTLSWFVTEGAPYLQGNSGTFGLQTDDTLTFTSTTDLTSVGTVYRVRPLVNVQTGPIKLGFCGDIAGGSLGGGPFDTVSAINANGYLQQLNYWLSSNEITTIEPLFGSQSSGTQYGKSQTTDPTTVSFSSPIGRLDVWGRPNSTAPVAPAVLVAMKIYEMDSTSHSIGTPPAASSGGYFASLKAPPGFQIVGFYGRSGDLLDALGVYIAPC